MSILNISKEEMTKFLSNVLKCQRLFKREQYPDDQKLLQALNLQVVSQ